MARNKLFSICLLLPIFSLPAEKILSRERSFIAPALVVRQEVKRSESIDLTPAKPERIIILTKSPNHETNDYFLSKNNTIYVKKSDRIFIQPTDPFSTPRTFYSIDGSPYRDSSGPIILPTSGILNLQYYTLDFFGNRENSRSVLIKPDVEPPILTLKWSVQPKTGEGKYLCLTSSLLSIDGKDEASGLRAIFWRNLGSKDWIKFEKPVSVSYPGNESIWSFEYYAIDMLENESPVKSFSCELENKKNEK